MISSVLKRAFLYCGNALSLLRWYHWCLILIPWVRIIPLPHGEDLVPTFADQGYTYQTMWYYYWSRLFELVCFIALYRHKRLFVFLLIAFLCGGKILDELTYYKGFYVGEFVYMPIGLILSLIVWFKRHK